VFLSFSVLAADYQSPRMAGMGGAGHGGPILTDAIYLNPAMISMLNAYSVSISSNKFKGPDDSEPRGRVVNLSIQDGTNDLFQAGVGYTQKSYNRQVNLGASSRVFEKYGIGIGGKYLFGSDSIPNAQDAIVSMVGAPLTWMQFGVVIDNAFQSTKMKAWNQYREIILGTKFNIQKILLVYADPHVIPDKAGDTFGYELGAELPIFTDLYIRGGLNKNSFQSHLGQYGDGHGFGIGWSFPRISFDAAFSRTIIPRETNNFLISITII
jgi:hypothetical protein